MNSPVVHVAVAIIFNQQNEVLISLRADTAHQGGLWEFPGGKVETGETSFDALKREILEELNLTVLNAEPLKQINFEYIDKSVCLEVFRVNDFSGEPIGAEGQQIKWQPVDQLDIQKFPMANKSIIHALTLPQEYLITGEFINSEEFNNRLERSLQNDISLVQLRAKHLSTREYINLASDAQSICDFYQAKLLVNTTPEIFYQIQNQTQVQGLHLNSHILHQQQKRPIAATRLLSVSCHNDTDLKKAKELSADIILLSPVKMTTSHPGVNGIGWDSFSQLISEIDIPVYALGGMTKDDLPMALSSGGQGIAAISNFWLK